MQWVQLQTDRGAKIMEFPGNIGKGRAVCRLSIRVVLKEELMGETELSCRLGYVLQHCICGTHLFK